MKLLVLLFSILATSAHAEIYKCGNTYTDKRCKDAVIVKAEPSIVKITNDKKIDSSVKITKVSIVLLELNEQTEK